MDFDNDPSFDRYDDLDSTPRARRDEGFYDSGGAMNSSGRSASPDFRSTRNDFGSTRNDFPSPMRAASPQLSRSYAKAASPRPMVRSQSARQMRPQAAWDPDTNVSREYSPRVRERPQSPTAGPRRTQSPRLKERPQSPTAGPRRTQSPRPGGRPQSPSPIEQFPPYDRQEQEQSPSYDRPPSARRSPARRTQAKTAAGIPTDQAYYDKAMAAQPHDDMPEALFQSNVQGPAFDKPAGIQTPHDDFGHDSYHSGHAADDIIFRERSPSGLRLEVREPPFIAKKAVPFAPETSISLNFDPNNQSQDPRIFLKKKPVEEAPAVGMNGPTFRNAFAQSHSDELSCPGFHNVSRIQHKAPAPGPVGHDYNLEHTMQTKMRVEGPVSSHDTEHLFAHKAGTERKWALDYSNAFGEPINEVLFHHKKPVINAPREMAREAMDHTTRIRDPQKINLFQAKKAVPRVPVTTGPIYDVMESRRAAHEKLFQHKQVVRGAPHSSGIVYDKPPSHMQEKLFLSKKLVGDVPMETGVTYPHHEKINLQEKIFTHKRAIPAPANTASSVIFPGNGPLLSGVPVGRHSGVQRIFDHKRTFNWQSRDSAASVIFGHEPGTPAAGYRSSSSFI